MMQPLSGDNSVLGIRGIGVDGSGFSNLIKSNERCRAKRFSKQFRGPHRSTAQECEGATPQLRSLAFCPTDDATGNARAGVARRLGFEIVRLGVYHNGASDHRPLVVR